MLPAPPKIVINPIEGAVKGVSIVVSGLCYGREEAKPLCYIIGGKGGFGLGSFMSVQNVGVRAWSTEVAFRYPGDHSIVVTDGTVATIIDFWVSDSV